jgi:hypothetical protein
MFVKTRTGVQLKFLGACRIPRFGAAAFLYSVHTKIAVASGVGNPEVGKRLKEESLEQTLRV